MIVSRAGAFALAEHEVAYRTRRLVALDGLTPLNDAARRDLMARRAALRAELARALGDVRRLRVGRVGRGIGRPTGWGAAVPRAEESAGHTRRDETS